MQNILANIRLPADKAQVSHVKQQLCTAARTANWQGEELDRFELVLEEAIMNIISYAYPGGGGDMTISLAVEGDRMLQLVLEDQGIPFNPTAAIPPNLDLPLDERVPGGLGVHLILTLSDAVTYRRSGDTNRLELTFRPRHPSPEVSR